MRPQKHGAKILPKSYFIHQEGHSVQIWWKLEKKWRFYEKHQTLASRGGAPLGEWVKNFTRHSFHIPRGSFYPNLVKIGWKRKIFWKTPKIGSQGAGQNFFWKIFFKCWEGPSVQISWRSGTRNKSFFTNHCKGEEGNKNRNLEPCALNLKILPFTWMQNNIPTYTY